MKKVVLSALFVGGLFAGGAFAQSQDQGFNNSMEAIAKNALRDAGCIDGGNYRAEVTPLLDNCYSVTLYPVPNAHIAPYVKLGAVGNVVVCNGEVTSVTCN